MTPDHMKSIRRLFLTGLLIVIAVIVSTRASSVQGSRDQCHRSASGAKAVGELARAQSTYLNLVLEADSVKQDVKRAAMVAQRVFDKTATVLERNSPDQLDCDGRYPYFPRP